MRVKDENCFLDALSRSMVPLGQLLHEAEVV